MRYLWRLNRIENKLDDTNSSVNYLFTKQIERE